ncbi:MAG: S49 family peptidase [Chlamydiia bacterium]|nr:S49 family peptidase [Chlamydiia bacterium]
MEVKRESIFVSAVRSFCNVFAGFIGILVGVIVIGIIVAVLSKPQMVSDKTQMIIAADADGNRSLLSHSAPVILRINIHGVIGSKDLNTKTMQAQLLDSRDGFLKDNRVKGILLHIDSPGGVAFDGHQIYQALIDYKEKYKVPVYAYVNGLCASAAYFIACSADKIYSPPVGMIGSVGALLGPNFNFAGLMERYGVKELTITEGKDKDMLSPYREWKPGEAQSLKDIVASDYELFVELVTKARPRLSKSKLINEYGAQVYNPIKAQEYGYIDDGNSSYSQTLVALVKEAGIDEEYQVVELKVLRPVLSDLIEGKSPILTGMMKHELSLPTELSPELNNRPLYLFSPALQWSANHDTR